MGQLVSHQALHQGVSGPTGLAAVWTLLQVRLHVAPQLGGRGVCFPTLLAAMGPFPGVQALVGPQGVGVPQGLTADRAEVGFPRVGDQVPAQLRGLGEALLAVHTTVRLLSCVDAQVSLQVSTLAEGFPAMWAGVWSLARVQTHMVPEGTRAGQLLGADWAAGFDGWLVLLLGPVSLPVYPERGPASKGFAANVTHKWALAGMEHLMLPEVSLHPVAFVTLLTLEWPLSTMHQYVGFVVLLGAVGF